MIIWLFGVVTFLPIGGRYVTTPVLHPENFEKKNTFCTSDDGLSKWNFLFFFPHWCETKSFTGFVFVWPYISTTCHFAEILTRRTKLKQVELFTQQFHGSRPKLKSWTAAFLLNQTPGADSTRVSTHVWFVFLYFFPLLHQTEPMPLLLQVLNPCICSKGSSNI